MFHFYFALYIMFNFTAPRLNSGQVFKINFQTKFFTVYNSVKCSSKRDIYLKFIVIYFNRNVFLYTNEGTFSNDTDSTSLPLYFAYAITSPAGLSIMKFCFHPLLQTCLFQFNCNDSNNAMTTHRTPSFIVHK